MGEIGKLAGNPCTLVLGIDEAGRGPALGPLVLAAVALSPEASRHLRRSGVADSKSFGSGAVAHAARKNLVDLIERAAAWIGIEICDVGDVDAYTSAGNLNVLERERAERLLMRAPLCRRVIADGRALFGPLKAKFPVIEARDRAETAHTAVAAASLCAKVRRDDLFACVANRYQQLFGPLRGAGYANKFTHAFARNYVRAFGHLPPEARASWPWRGDPALRRVAAMPSATCP